MKTGLSGIAVVAVVLLTKGVLPALAQTTLPPQAIAQFQDVIGSRVEAVTILGGDYGAASGIYSFRGGDVADLSLSKIGGGGNVAEPRPLGESGLKWAPLLEGNLGHITAENKFRTRYLQGNRTVYDVLAVQAGGGARFYLTDHFSVAPSISGIYGHTENEFKPQNAIGDFVDSVGKGTYVDWEVDTWSVAPSAEVRYDWRWRRTIFGLSSRYNFFHTESFSSSSAVISVDGNSHTWENKIDADVPLGFGLFGQELHTGGFFSRMELFGGAAHDLKENRIYTANGRLVLDLLGKVWKVRWIGVGASYFFGENFGGWSAGLDMRLEF